MTRGPLDPNNVSRRQFVGTVALGAAWLAAAEACTRDNARAHAGDSGQAAPRDTAHAAPRTLQHLSADQGAAVDAITARIIPGGDSPGAREAGALWFIDATLGTFAKDQLPLFTEGLASLDKAVKTKHGATATFAALKDDEQDAMLRTIEKTPFFGAMRFATLGGFLALPKYGGNKDFVGWKFIGQDNVMEHKAPFGWYDRPENQQALLGTVL